MTTSGSPSLTTSPARDHDLGYRTGHLGEHRDLHLHRLQDHHRVVGRHLLADLDLHLQHGGDELGDDGMAHWLIVGFPEGSLG